VTGRTLTAAAAPRRPIRTSIPPGRASFFRKLDYLMGAFMNMKIVE